MKKTNNALLALALASAFGAHAADVSIEGRWLSYTEVQASKDTTCTISVYGAADASTALWTTNGCRLATDSDGNFVIGVKTASEVALPSTFWVGVKPADFDEISPRFRVAPVPFAIAAEEVELVQSSGAVELTGVATVDRIETTGDMTVGDWVIPSGGRVEARNLQVASARVSSMEITPGGMLGMFNDGGKAASANYDTMQSDYSKIVEARIEASGVFFVRDDSYDNSVSGSCKFENDGFLVVAIKADPKSCPGSRMTLSVGTTDILSDREFGTKNGGEVRRFMTVPYRAGEEVRYSLTAKGGGTIPFGEQANYKSSIGVKMRLVKFGLD